MHSIQFKIKDLNKYSNDYDMAFISKLDNKKISDQLDLMGESLKRCIQSIENNFSKNGSDFLVRVCYLNEKFIKDFTFFSVYGEQNNG